MLLNSAKENQGVSFIKIISFLLIGISACVTAKANADDFTVTTKLSLLSEYYSRGIEQTEGNPAPQIFTTIGHKSGIHGGFFVSRVEFADGDQADQELDYFLDFRNKLGDLHYRVGVIYYTFPSADSTLNYNFWELDLGLGYELGPIYSELSLKHSPNHFGASGELRYVKLYTTAPLSEKINFHGHIAHRHIENNAGFGNIPDSFDWEAGIEYKPVKNVGLLAKYVDSSLSESECFNSTACRGRIVAGINYYF